MTCMKHPCPLFVSRFGKVSLNWPHCFRWVVESLGHASSPSPFLHLPVFRPSIVPSFVFGEVSRYYIDGNGKQTRFQITSILIATAEWQTPAGRKKCSRLPSATMPGKLLRTEATLGVNHLDKFRPGASLPSIKWMCDSFFISLQCGWNPDWQN